jgi:hypothetical protein
MLPSRTSWAKKEIWGSRAIGVGEASVKAISGASSGNPIVRLTVGKSSATGDALVTATGAMKRSGAGSLGKKNLTHTVHWSDWTSPTRAPRGRA